MNYLLKPYVFIFSIIVLILTVYTLNSVFVFTPYFLYNDEFFTGYIKTFLFFSSISFFCYLSYRGKRISKVFDRNVKSKLKLAYILLIVSSSAILLTAYDIYNKLGISGLMLIVRGELNLGVLTSYKSSFSIFHIFHFLLPISSSCFALVEKKTGKKYDKIYLIIIAIGIFRSFFSLARLFILFVIFPILYIKLEQKKINTRKLSIGFALFIALFIFQANLRHQTDSASYKGGGLSFVEHIIGGVHLGSVLGAQESHYNFPVETFRYLKTIGQDNVWEESFNYQDFEVTYGKKGFNVYGLFGNVYIDLGNFFIVYAFVLGWILGFLYKMYKAGDFYYSLLFLYLMSILIDSGRTNLLAVTQGVVPMFFVIFLRGINYFKR